MHVSRLSIAALGGFSLLSGCSFFDSGSSRAPATEMTVPHAQAICEASFANTAIRAGHTDFFISSAFLAQDQRISADEEYIVFGHVRGTSGQYWPVTAICAVDTRTSVDETWMPNLSAVSNFHIVHEPAEASHRQRLQDGVFAAVIR